MTEGNNSPADGAEQTTLVNSDHNSDSYSELSNLESPSRLSPLEDEVSNFSVLPLSQMKTKRLLEIDDSYFVPISHDQAVSPVTSWFSPVISNNGPSAFTKVNSSQNELTSNKMVNNNPTNNNNDEKLSNLIKLNHIKSAFVKSEPYCCSSRGRSSPGSVGQMFSWKKRIKKEAYIDDRDSPRNGADPMVSSVNVSPLGVKDAELSDEETNVESFKVRALLLTCVKWFRWQRLRYKITSIPSLNSVASTSLTSGSKLEGVWGEILALME